MKNVRWIFLGLLFISKLIVSQESIDTIITIKNDTIPCKITYVSHYSVFYKYKKRKRFKEKILPRIDVDTLIINSKNITVQKKKEDSGINQYYKKSTLKKSYAVLWLKKNDNKHLKLLADSVFHQKTTDYFLIANRIMAFAKRYRCKLIYVSDIEQGEKTYQVHVKLYDAPDSVYLSVLNGYKTKRVFFIRTNNSFEKEIYKFRYQKMKYTLKKNTYITLDKKLRKSKSDEDDMNIYYFVGYLQGYSLHTTPEVASVIGSIAATVITGSPTLFIAVKTKGKYKVSPFVGEFMMQNIRQMKKHSPEN